PGDASAVLTAVRPGSVTLAATTAEGVRTERPLTIEESPVRSLSLKPSQEKARTGDVVRFEATALDGSGRGLPDAPIRYLLEAWPDPSRPDTVGAGAPAQVARDGRFVAEQAGAYTVLAVSGNATAQVSVVIEPRNVKREIELVGHAPVRDRISSDLWVWEGVDGRDYAVHGTWNADGHTFFYDVTDPSKMELIDQVQVDARTVNDVKVSEDGRICVISREGASNRRNGLVILDVTNPRDVQILAQYDDGMTGGVHNVFIHENHVYAVNNGRRWDVLDIEDPRQPARVARFETETPGRSVHDVWVRDGIAYQAGNTDALILVDVGGGGKGGSPARPVEMGRMPQLTGWNHSVWPFRSQSAGKFYVVGGDEAHPYNPRVPDEIISWKERLPSRAMGWVHFIEFDDLDAPREIARYQVPEAGPHNYWIDWEQEVMYVAYFNAGLRVVDVSGELMGDLYRQGREIAKFYSDDSEGYVPNAPFVWGPQPYKGTIFFSDFHSGLWAVRLVPPLGGDEKKTSSMPAPPAGRGDSRAREENVP
ncbi:MAG: LVIVD repeat-containing protein, partial [Vicinamibacteria bacterium]